MHKLLVQVLTLKTISVAAYYIDDNGSGEDDERRQRNVENRR